MKKENALLLNSLQEEVQTRKRIEHELMQSKQKIRFLEGNGSCVTDESHASDSYGSQLTDGLAMDYNNEDDTKILRFSASVKENLVENYFK